ncbi:bola-like protein [Phanerochaete sordida]|uniref:Bola-like protein n=1 Tax=Phanerochaete sordida TaxID=48140 RepID=A0A9P3FY56_9APHY|nr:bola-like protein [Phanerochaete sordida]
MLAATLSRRRILQTCLRSRPLQLRSYAVPPPQGKDEGELNIYNKLNDRFDPTELAVQDVSGGCGTFYAISIASEAFRGLSTVKQHRLVNEVLKKEIEGIHGLQLRTTTPESS